jgi:hypothetical protein
MRKALKFAVTAAVAVGMAFPAAGAAGTVRLDGRWQQLVNCAITSFSPSTKQFRCLGSSLWTGGLTGVTNYVAFGTVSLLSGDAAGAITETFRGRDAHGHRGTIAFTERFVLDGGASRIHIDAYPTGGTGGFAGVSGYLAFNGFDNVVTGFGTWGGFLRLPG